MKKDLEILITLSELELECQESLAKNDEDCKREYPINLAAFQKAKESLEQLVKRDSLDKVVLELTLMTLLSQMKDGKNDILVAVIENALKGKRMTVGMTASVITHYHFETIREKCQGLIDTYGTIEKIAIDFEVKHAHIEEWDVFLEDSKSCDWEVYLSNWVIENFINK